jgi:hypothetical protein
MTALQDWFSPVTPSSIKAVLWDAWRGLTSEDVPADPTSGNDLIGPFQLMAPGLERC